ncbi:enoyl-CoA hydratase-related protein [Mangrovibacterium marinum]|uniref:Methylglutaconyl-CoA hydratase n=1 Tax=Mangrovibacterium marinum TaxID=1639118 RepID=A0A2T5C1Z4_9BACT|nr:enoyl-CoA hydratase-related protein [Mangrovibacterium marinum]PTN08703.1 methylglutaconyl-CoA hydratase [Mangrovibacterium marinum]
MKEFKNIIVQIDNNKATILLNRPKQHNALNPELISDMHEALEELEGNDQVHFVVFAGEGRSFCAGADISWFANAVNREKSENWQEYLQMADLLKKIYNYPKVTIAAAHKNVLGGANGLVAACDFAVAEKSTAFAFGEVKLGIIPATILPFVAKRLSTQNLKKLMFSGERIWTAEAQTIGLVDFVAEDGRRWEVVNKLISELQQVSPNALKACKNLVLKVDSGEVNTDSSEYTAAVLAELVESEEGQEGLRAFLEKRKPDWSALKISEN